MPEGRRKVILDTAGLFLRKGCVFCHRARLKPSSFVVDEMQFLMCRTETLLSKSIINVTDKKSSRSHFLALREEALNTQHTHHVRKFQRAFSPGRRTAMKSIFPRNIQLNQTHYVRQLQKNDTMPALENTF
jgi:hypothetical protein